MLGLYISNFTFDWITYKLIRTSNEIDSVLCMMYWRIGWRFSAQTGGWEDDTQASKVFSRPE
jgi:hypothetical protein